MWELYRQAGIEEEMPVALYMKGGD